MKKYEKNGISLIVLVITIIVVVIIATAIILNITNGGIMDSARKAKFMSDFKSVEDGVSLYSVSNIDMKNASNYKLPTEGKLSLEDKVEITRNVPTLKAKIEELNPGKTLSDLDLYWINEPAIGANGISTEKKQKGYIIDGNTRQIYDYVGDFFSGVRWHTLDGGVPEMEKTVGDIQELWNGWIRLTLYYPKNSTDKKWRLGTEGELRVDPMLMWQNYTGPITIPLDRTKDIWIKYKINNKEVTIPPAGTLLVDIIPDSTGTTKVSKVNVKINYDESATVKEYKVANSGWMPYTGPFDITENCIVEARAKKSENVYNTDGSLLLTKDVAGSDKIYIGNIGVTESAVNNIDTALTAPTIERLPAVGAEKARVRITYPANADKKIYTINSGAEQSYTQDIIIDNWGTYVAAYYYDVSGKRSIASVIMINEVITPPIIDLPVKKAPAPTITRLPAQDGSEKARVKIDYPADAGIKVYTINYGAEQKYVGEASIINWNTNVVAYYYDAKGNKSEAISIFINDTSNGEAPEQPKLENPKTEDIQVIEPAPIMTRLEAQNTSEKAEVKIDYPVNAVKKIYKINNGEEQLYSSNISINVWGTNVVAYYYDVNGNMSKSIEMTINDTSAGDAPESSQSFTPAPPEVPGAPLPVVPKTNVELPAPTIERLEGQNSDEKARVSVTYPAGALRKTYTINYGAEIEYTSDIPIYGWGTDVMAYYYDADGNRSKVAIININDTTDGKPEEPPTTFKPLDPDLSDYIAPPTIDITPTTITNEVTATVTSPGVAIKTYIKIGRYGEYKEYTGLEKITENTEVFAYYRIVSGEKSVEARVQIDNIGNTIEGQSNNKPYLAIDALPYPWPGSYNATDVLITFKYSSADKVEYSEDGITYKAYTAPFKVTENKRIYARATNINGVTEANLDITNIGQLKEPKPMVKLAISINAQPDPTLSTEKVANVNVSIEYDSTATEKSYSIGKYGEVKTYTGPFAITNNCTIYAYAKGVNSQGEATKTIDNLLNGISDPLILTDPIPSKTASKVMVSIQYDKYANVKKYSIDGGPLQDYTAPFEVTKNNTRIYAYNANAAGQKSEATYVIQNIIPELPTLVLDKGSYYLVKLNYPTGSISNEYKWKENGEWKNYKSDGIILVKPQYKDQLIKNGTLVKIEDENGNKIDFKGDFYIIDVPITELFENISMRWDRTAPKAPQIVINPIDTTKSVIANIIYEDGLLAKQYRVLKLDGVLGDWQNYNGPITIDRNNTIIYARGMDDSEVWSQEGLYKVTNIDEISPVINVTADITTALRKISATINVTDNFEVSKVKWTKNLQGESYFANNGTEISNNSVLDITENGYYTFYAEDKVGNTVVYTLNVQNIDATAPSNPSISATPITWTNGNVISTITYPSDSNKNEYSLDGTTWLTYTSELNISNNTTIYARAIDLAGNQSGQSTLTIANIDKISPNVTYTNNGGVDLKTISTVVTVNDLGGSNLNVPTLQYVWDIQNTTQPSSGWTTFTNGSTITNNERVGSYYLWVKATDNAGNAVVTKSNAFIPDSIAPTNPTLTANPSTWTNGNVTVSITYAIDAYIKEYSLDGLTWNTYTSPITVTTNNTTVYARCNDEVGNQSGQSTITVANIDRIIPAVEFGTNGSTDLTQVGTKVTVTDTGSGVNTTTLQYKWDTQNITTPSSGWTTFTNASTLTKTGDGAYYLWIKGSDNIGNTATVVSNQFIVGEVVTSVSTVKPYNATFAGLTTGFVYNNPVIPAGFIAMDTGDAKWTQLSTDWNKGLVIQDSSGNQFVWVPLDGTNVSYTRWCTTGFYTYMVTTDDTQPADFNTANITTKYQGFYVARYEAMFDYNNGSLRTASKKNTSVALLNYWSKDSAHTGCLWNWVNYNDSKSYSESMDTSYGYDTSLMGTNLITGTQWDTLMKWIQNSGKDVTTNSSTWGNYMDSSVIGHGGLNISGYSNYWRAKNIYDIAGNAWEYTSEKNDTYPIYRGGDWQDNGSYAMASFRCYAANWSMNYGNLTFRVALYVK